MSSKKISYVVRSSAYGKGKNKGLRRKEVEAKESSHLKRVRKKNPSIFEFAEGYRVHHQCFDRIIESSYNHLPKLGSNVMVKISNEYYIPMVVRQYEDKTPDSSVFEEFNGVLTNKNAYDKLFNTQEEQKAVSIFWLFPEMLECEDKTLLIDPRGILYAIEYIDISITNLLPCCVKVGVSRPRMYDQVQVVRDVNIFKLRPSETHYVLLSSDSDELYSPCIVKKEFGALQSFPPINIPNVKAAFNLVDLCLFGLQGEGQERKIVSYTITVKYKTIPSNCSATGVAKVGLYHAVGSLTEGISTFYQCRSGFNRDYACEDLCQVGMGSARCTYRCDIKLSRRFTSDRATHFKELSQQAVK